MERRRRRRTGPITIAQLPLPLPFSALYLSLFTLCMSALFFRSLVCDTHLLVQCQANLKPQLPFSLSLLSHKGQFSSFPFLSPHAPVFHLLWGLDSPFKLAYFAPNPAPSKTSSFSLFLSLNSHVLERVIQPSLPSSFFALLPRKARLHLLSVLILHHHYSCFQL